MEATQTSVQVGRSDNMHDSAYLTTPFAGPPRSCNTETSLGPRVHCRQEMACRRLVTMCMQGGTNGAPSRCPARCSSWTEGSKDEL